MTTEPSDRTRYLAQLIGLVSIIVSLAILLRRDVMTARLLALVQDPAALMVLDFGVLAAAVAWILAHNRWHGGVLTIIVTLVGWILLARGLLILILSQDDLTEFVTMIGLPERAPVFGGIGLVFGLLMTWAGFRR